MSESEYEDSQMPQREKKKKRVANFTPAETHVLLTLVSDEKNIIENKKTDGVSMHQKNAAWKKIKDLFNSSCPQGNYRNVESLKKLYENKKREIRKRKAEERRDVLLTGGGPPIKKNENNNEDLLLSIVDPLTVVGGSSTYGSDSISLDIPEPQQTEYFTFEFDNQEQSLKDVLVKVNEEPSSSKQGVCENESKRLNWKKGSDLSEPISTPLKRPAFVRDRNNNNEENENLRNVSKRRPNHTVVRALSSSQLAEKYNILADKKNTIADYTLKKIKLDIKHAEEEHSAKMESMRLHIELKKQQLKYNDK